MIDYTPFWKTCKNRGETWYSLTRKHGMPDATLSRLKHNRNVSTQTLNDLCRILKCGLSDLARYIPDETDGLDSQE